MAKDGLLGRACAMAAILGAVACSAGSDFGKTGQAVLYSDAQADWSRFPDGYQCLVAVQLFYPNVFGAAVPVAPGSWNGACGPYGACHLWVDAIPDAGTWERIANDGSEQPSPYDMIVFPPTSTNEAGHIAAVDHVDEQGNVYVMDDNFNFDERKAWQPHTVSRGALGWYHLRSLPKSSQAPSPPPPDNAGSCPNDGLYCGGDYIGGDPSTLYQCISHELHVVQACADGCQVNPSGINDACKSAPAPVSTWCPNNGLYCGGDYIQGDPSTLYQCWSHQLSVYQACANGCAVQPDGTNDYCY
jgi:hypothetical protein